MKVCIFIHFLFSQTRSAFTLHKVYLVATFTLFSLIGRSQGYELDFTYTESSLNSARVTDMVVNGDYLHAIYWGDRDYIATYDISNGRIDHLLSSIEITDLNVGSSSYLTVDNDFLYFKSQGSDGIYIYDMTDKVAPVLASIIENLVDVDGGSNNINGRAYMNVRGNYLYLTFDVAATEIAIIDISNPYNPQQVFLREQSFSETFNAADFIAISDSKAYIALSNTIREVSISTPSNVVIPNRSDPATFELPGDEVKKMILVEDRYLVGVQEESITDAIFFIYDTNTNGLLSSLQLDINLFGKTRLVYDEDLNNIIIEEDALYVVDISTLSQPALIDGNSPTGELGVAYTKGVLYAHYNNNEILHYSNGTDSQNNSPIVSNPISDLSFNAGFSLAEIDVSTVFSDPDGDELTYNASSNNTAVTTVSVSEATLFISEQGVGTSLITLTASDGKGGSISEAFEVEVSTSSNSSPILVNSFNDYEIASGFTRVYFTLTSYFSDPDDDELLYTAVSSNEDVVTVEIDGDRLYLAEGSLTSSSTIFVTADDGNGAMVSDEFVWTTTQAGCGGLQTITELSGTISDGSGNDNYGNLLRCDWLIAPNVAEGIITISFNEFNIETDFDFLYIYDGDNSSTAPLLGVFTGDSPPNIIESTGKQVYLVFVTDFTVNNQGWEISYTTSIDNQHPQVTNQISDQTFTQGFSTERISLENVFTDPDGDQLTYSAETSDVSVVSVSIDDVDLIITEGGSIGSATIQVSADDGNGGTASTDFEVSLTEVAENRVVESDFSDNFMDFVADINTDPAPEADGLEGDGFGNEIIYLEVMNRLFFFAADRNENLTSTGLTLFEIDEDDQEIRKIVASEKYPIYSFDGGDIAISGESIFYRSYPDGDTSNPLSIIKYNAKNGLLEVIDDSGFGLHALGSTLFYRTGVGGVKYDGSSTQNFQEIDYSVKVGNNLIFQSDQEIYYLENETSQPILLLDDGDGRIGGLSVKTSAMVNDKVIFAVNNAFNIGGVYVTDGTKLGTTQILDFGEASEIIDAIPYDAGLIFIMRANDDELQGVWYTGGSAESTVRLTSAYGWNFFNNTYENSDVKTISFLEEYEGQIWFVGRDDDFNEGLWSTDGTVSGTEVTYPYISGTTHEGLLSVGDLLLYDGLNVYTGSTGTSIEKVDGDYSVDLSFGNIDDPLSLPFYKFHNSVYFAAETQEGNVNLGKELWRINGDVEFQGPLSFNFSNNLSYIFPNPASDYFYLSIVDGSPPERVSLLTLDGKLVRDYQYNLTGFFDIKTLHGGPYLVQLTIAGEKTIVGRLIKVQ